MAFDPWLAGAAWLACVLLLATRLRRRPTPAGGAGTCASCPARASEAGRRQRRRGAPSGPPQ